MVIDEVSPRRIRNYLHRWVMWWVNATETWRYRELINSFIGFCWDANVAAYATSLHELHLIKELCNAILPFLPAHLRNGIAA
jgi:hypothetical protein